MRPEARAWLAQGERDLEDAAKTAKVEAAREIAAWGRRALEGGTHGA